MSKKSLITLLAACTMLTLVACNKPTVDVPIDPYETTRPTEKPGPTTSQQPHVNEWNKWTYDDPDIKVPTYMLNGDGEEVYVDEDGKTVEEVGITGDADTVIAAVQAAGIDNVTGWWHSEGDTHYSYYGLNDLDEVEDVLNAIGYSLETCQPNRILRADGFTMRVEGSYEKNYQIVIRVGG